MFGKGHHPPAGWTIGSGRLEEVPTVQGYLARRVDVHGRCHTRDCRRTCQLNLGELVTKGMGLLTVRTIQQTLRCSRLDNCALYFDEKPAFVLTLGELAGRDYVGVEIRCSLCGARYLTTVEGLIHRLKASGQGDASTPAMNVGALIRGACTPCKAARWEVGFLWYDPGANRVPIWKQDLQKRIDEAQRRRDIERGLVT